MNKHIFITALSNLTETSFNSFCWFLENGLANELRAFSARLNSKTIRIYHDEFILKKPKYSALYCKKYDLTYTVSIYVPVERVTTKQMIESFVFFGELPLMTEEGTFIINGCERIIINQIISSYIISYHII